MDSGATDRPGDFDDAGAGDAGADDAGGTDDDDGGATDDAGGDASVTIPPALLTQERWANAQNGFWDGQKWLAGDFDGDGRSDLANVFDDRGQASIDVHQSTGWTFAVRRWATQQNGFWDAQKWLAGDFDGDGRSDLANVFDDQGQASINLYLSTGSSFVVQRWSTRQNGFWDGQKWLAGDFDGDGRADLANVFEDEGQVSIDLHLSTGSSFVVQRWVTRQNGFWDGQKWLAGDFDGDRRVDLANVFDDLGQASIDVHRSTGWTFTSERWVTRQVGFWDAQKWLAADFDDDGQADLANVFNDLGLDSIDIHRSTGWTFTSERWVTQQGGFWDAQKWLAGDFDGDRRADLANVFGDQRGAAIDVRRQIGP